jgi:Uncharacterized protein conserved in bacteria (DUF2188)
MQQQLSYDIIPHDSGWAIVITPSESNAFATKQDAFDAASEHARKLRFAGYSLGIRVRGSDARNFGRRQSL